MLKAAVLLCLLALLTVPAGARPAHAAWHFWFSKPERHGSRKLAGDFTHINTTYRYHSRERRGLLSFLHLRGQRPVTARHQGRKGQTHAASKTGHRHTSGLF